MFIKKDPRKIPDILSDHEDKREYLKLSKRSAEFHGSTRSLFRENSVQSFLGLRVLNLYDNELTSLQGIGLLAHSPVEDINIGGNKLSTIPLEMGLLTSLRSLWLDDNLLNEFPICLCELVNLTSLRLSGNSISELPSTVANLQKLEVLALDNNDFEEIPDCVYELSNLRELWIRQNKISHIPEDISQLSNLEILSVSSNKLTAIGDCIAALISLRRLYANGNVITALSSELPSLPKLETINLSNNLLTTLPESWTQSWGHFAPELGCLVISSADAASKRVVNIMLLGNHIGTTSV